MRPLTLDDLLPLDEFLARREEFFEANERYGERYRRLRIGPVAELHFENRQTLWFRAQELLRVLRMQDTAWITAELDLINKLLPRSGELVASLIISGDERPESVRLCFPGASLVPSVESAPVLTGAHWLRFVFNAEELLRFSDPSQSAWCEIGSVSSDAISDEMRQSLLDDLEASR